jgi:hypothetical protein
MWIKNESATEQYIRLESINSITVAADGGVWSVYPTSGTTGTPLRSFGSDQGAAEDFARELIAELGLSPL